MWQCLLAKTFSNCSNEHNVQDRTFAVKVSVSEYLQDLKSPMIDKACDVYKHVLVNYQSWI